jgi:hypothetical protein
MLHIFKQYPKVSIWYGDSKVVTFMSIKFSIIDSTNRDVPKIKMNAHNLLLSY